MRLILILMVVYIGVSTFIIQKLLGLPEFDDAIFPGIAVGILLTVLQITIKKKLKEK